MFRRRTTRFNPLRSERTLCPPPRALPPLIAALVWIAATSSATAQERGCVLRVEQTVLEVGEMAPVELICLNTGQPEAPEASLPDGLELRLMNAIPAHMSQTSIINGRVSRETRYTFSLQLTGMREGAYTLGPIRVKADGDIYETNSVRITVRRTPIDAKARGDRRLFVEMTVEPTSLYVTQTITATLTIGVRKIEIGGRTYEADMLRQVLDLNASQLSVFAGGQARQSEQTLADSEGRRHRYVLYRVEQRIQADEVGDMRIGPVFIKARYPTAVRQGFFRRIEFSRFETEFARADAVTVTVKGPPVDGRPSSFTGAIGHYLLEADVKPTRIKLGEPVTLSLTIRGEPLESVAGPDLSNQPELTSRFDFAHDELVGDIEGGAKVFRRAIFPKQAGDQTVPPIEWSYFDPDQERYVTLRTEAIPIVVERRAAEGEPAISLVPTNTQPANTPTLTVVSGGLAAIYVEPEVVLADQSFSLSSPLVVAALTLPPVLCLVVALTTQHYRRLRADAGYARRRRARTHAEALLRQALNNGSPSEQWSLLGRAVTNYLCDRFDLPARALTPSEARDILVRHNLNGGLPDEVADFLTMVDAVRYAPGMVGDASPEETARRVRGWIRHIEERT